MRQRTRNRLKAQGWIDPEYMDWWRGYHARELSDVRQELHVEKRRNTTLQQLLDSARQTISNQHAELTKQLNRADALEGGWV